MAELEIDQYLADIFKNTNSCRLALQNIPLVLDREFAIRKPEAPNQALYQANMAFPGDGIKIDSVKWISKTPVQPGLAAMTLRVSVSRMGTHGNAPAAFRPIEKNLLVNFDASLPVASQVATGCNQTVCAPNEVVTWTADQTMQCTPMVDLIRQALAGMGTCPQGTHLTGFDASGTPICASSAGAISVNYQDCQITTEMFQQNQASTYWGSNVPSDLAAEHACPIGYVMVGVNNASVRYAYCCRLNIP